MTGRSLGVVVLAVLSAAAVQGYRPYEGVDPNTLSCDPEGQIFLLLPHFTDCNKFFMCTHGEEVEFSCSSPELIFDFEIQSCNWAWAGTCVLRTPDSDGNGDLEGSGEDSQEWQPEQNAASPERAPLGSLADLLDGSLFDDVARPAGMERRRRDADQGNYGSAVLNCRRPDSAGKQVPYPHDCQRYWRCEDGAPAVATCSDGLFFNARSQQCDFEANAKCSVEDVDELQSEFIAYH